MLFAMLGFELGNYYPMGNLPTSAHYCILEADNMQKSSIPGYTWLRVPPKSEGSGLEIFELVLEQMKTSGVSGMEWFYSA